jgi:hypothetical protein
MGDYLMAMYDTVLLYMSEFAALISKIRGGGGGGGGGGGEQ